MLKLNVNNETSRLLVVVLGTAKSNGITPKIDDCYDPSSRQNVLNQTYPSEDDMIDEMNQFKQVLYKYNIDIIRPSIIDDYNHLELIKYIPNNIKLLCCYKTYRSLILVLK